VPRFAASWTLGVDVFGPESSVLHAPESGTIDRLRNAIPQAMPRTESRPSLRTELLVSFAILAVLALCFAVGSVVLLYDTMEPSRAVLSISILIVADVAFVVMGSAYQVHRLVVRPLRNTAAAAEAIANGDLRRRVPKQASCELQQLATSVNSMTDRLLQEQAQLVRVEKLASVGRLGAGIANEIGAPLDAIARHTNDLRSNAGEDGRTLRTVGGLERETARIDRIVRGLLDYARPRQAGPTPIDANETLRRVVDMLNAQGVLRRVSLRLELADEAPYVFGERNDLEQVFVNLLLNAADAVEGTGTVAIRTMRMPRSVLEEGVVRRVDDPPLKIVPHSSNPRVRQWLKAQQRPAEVVKIVVADSGPGVRPENFERIFDPFFTTKEAGKGTGLGLAIVARVVDNFEGIVWVQKAREGGAAFHLIFPLAPASLAVEEPADLDRLSALEIQP
jgi:two-component system NtrC family sensor kinase